MDRSIGMMLTVEMARPWGVFLMPNMTHSTDMVLSMTLTRSLNMVRAVLWLALQCWFSYHEGLIPRVWPAQARYFVQQIWLART
jgi:hypothetical protein